MCTKYEANKYISLYIPTGYFGLGFFFSQPEIKASITDLF